MATPHILAPIRDMSSISLHLRLAHIKAYRWLKLVNKKSYLLNFISDKLHYAGDDDFKGEESKEKPAEGEVSSRIIASIE